MDRDRRWERTKLAYDAIAHADGPRADSAQAAIEAAHGDGVTDEFIEPTVIGDYDGMADGDVVIHFNFRPDRARQLCRALGEEGFEEFDRGESPDVALTTLTSLPGRLGVPRGVLARAPGDDAGRGAWPSAATASSTWRRPRSTRT